MSFSYMLKTLLGLLVFFSSCSIAVDENKVYNHMDDIREARIGVILGSTQDAMVSQKLPEAKSVRLENEADMFLSLRQGKCDVVMFDLSVLSYAKHYIPGIEVVPSNFPVDYYGVAFQKDDTELQAQFNSFLKKIKANGLYQEIYDRWVSHGTDSEMPSVELPSVGEPLRVGVSATLYPFAFMKDQQFVGFDIEMTLRFAQFIQRPVTLQNISFGSLIASLQADKVDFITSSITITEEREEMVLFSDPYFETYTVVASMPQTEMADLDVKGFWQSLKDSFYSNILTEKRYLLIWEGLKSTVIISFFSLVLGTLLGGLVCFMRMSKRSWLRSISAIYISLMRGMPVLVLLMLMFYVFLADLPVDGVQVAVITFALNYAAYVSEMFRSAIQGVDRGQTEAGIALGFTPVQTFYHIIMPQALKNVLPVYKGEMISLIKMTSIVGYIAVEDLTKMSDIIRSRTFDAFFPLIMVAILYFVLAWIFGKALDLLFAKKQPEL